MHDKFCIDNRHIILLIAARLWHSMPTPEAPSINMVDNVRPPKNMGNG